MEGNSVIDKEQLLNYARTKKYNLGQAEKAYYQEIILFILYNTHGKNLVFKGGTALTKCYGLDRFSEDLDFVASKEEDFSGTIKKGLTNFYIEFECIEKKHKESIDLTYYLKGPLYNGQKNSMCKILLDISLRDETLLPPKIIKIGLDLQEIPLFEVVVLSEKEILLEKIRALLTREKARDLYDLYYLTQKEIVTIEEINKKLASVGKKFVKQELMKAILDKQRIWETEISRLVKKYPPFNEIKDFLEKYFTNCK
jgi:hypothetical protein